jgi:hypothetical protein
VHTTYEEAPAVGEEVVPFQDVIGAVVIDVATRRGVDDALHEVGHSELHRHG